MPPYNPPMSDLLISEHNGYRTLHFGSEWVQGRMRIRKPAELSLAYAQEMTAALLFAPPAGNVYVAGLGVGALPRWAFANWGESLKRMDVVELRADVISLAQHSFPLPLDDRRLRIVCDDAAAAIQAKGESTIDWIWVDCYDGRGRVGALESSEFYESCHRAMKKRGVLVANMWSNVPRYRPGLKRLQKVFGDNIALLPSIETENVIMIASKSPLVSGDLATALASPAMRAHARTLTLEYDLPFSKWLSRITGIRSAV